MITGKSISTGNKETLAIEVGESVRVSMLDAAKGKQMYAQSCDGFEPADFKGFDKFVNLSEQR